MARDRAIFAANATNRTASCIGTYGRGPSRGSPHAAADGKRLALKDLLWRRGLAQVLLEESNYLGVKVLVKVGAIEARGVGADGSELLCLLRGAQGKEGKVFRIFDEMIIGRYCKRAIDGSGTTPGQMVGILRGVRTP
jgi:hypothetical protein